MSGKLLVIVMISRDATTDLGVGIQFYAESLSICRAEIWLFALLFCKHSRTPLISYHLDSKDEFDTL